MSSKSIIGRQFANFRILRHLGHGGMADVYLGHDVQLDRSVAIKVLDPAHRGDRAYAKRFVREAQAIAGWRHPNIIQVFYADQEEDLPYFVMEYIDGRDLGDILSRKRKLMSYEDVITIGRAVANALDYAHKQDVVHRDVKPSNVMLATDKRVVLMDFGLALDMTEGSVGEVFGSANYVSPEQARNSAEAVPQSDVYSLGVMLYEMLVGKLPFDDPSFTTVAIQHITEPPPPPREINPNLSEETEKVILKALHKSPQRRYRTAGQLMDALEEALKKAEAAEKSSKKRSSTARSKTSVTQLTRSKRSPGKQPAASKSSAAPLLASDDSPPPLLAGDPQSIYKRIAIVAGAVIALILILVLLLWLLGGEAEAAGPAVSALIAL